MPDGVIVVKYMAFRENPRLEIDDQIGGARPRCALEVQWKVRGASSPYRWYGALPAICTVFHGMSMTVSIGATWHRQGSDNEMIGIER